ncbi:MAG: NAD(P)H-dependent oxidoreductase [Crocinitomicaceae bacterium]|nr:NAD(P)H-dependent oxidoreductase [Crocinitomicaceae bacterium]
MSKIIAFSGSNSKSSINQQLITVVAELVEGSEVEVIDLRDFPAPVYGIDLEMEEGMPAKMVELNGKLAEADGFIISSPEHNGSMPAVLKNTIDWLSRIEQKVFNDKPTIFMSTSPGPRGGMSALEHLVAIMPYRGAKVVGSYSLGSFGENLVDGKLNADKHSEIQEVLRSLEKEIN